MYRYGTCDDPLDSAEMTSPSAVRLLLIDCASYECPDWEFKSGIWVRGLLLFAPTFFHSVLLSRFLSLSRLLSLSPALSK